MLGGYGVMLVWTLLAFGSSIAQDLAEARGAETEGWQLDLDMLRILSPFKTAEELNGESLPSSSLACPNAPMISHDAAVWDDVATPQRRGWPLPAGSRTERLN